MKTIYTYHFSNRKFTCTIESNEKIIKLQERKAIESLQLLDTLSFDKIQVFKHSIRLYKGNFEIHLRDLDLFVQNKLDQYIPKLYKKLEESIKDYLRMEAKKKQKQNKKLNPQNKIFKVTIGATLMMVLLSSISLKTEDGKINESTSIETDSLNQENSFEENNTFSIPKEDIVETENRIEESNVQMQTTKEMQSPLEEENLSAMQNQENIVYLNYTKTDDLIKKEHASEEYEELANWCGEKWGMSPNLILMQKTQESEGDEENLMQIDWDKWAGEPIRAYNFRDNKYETFLLTNNPTEEQKANCTCITQNDLKNPKTNMSIGCVLLRKSAEYMDYHIMAALQCYNLGPGNMDKIFDKIKEETGQTKEEILSDQTNITFYNYTYVPGEGDPNYLSNVFQFIDEYGDSITFKHLQNGEVVEETLHVYNEERIL